MPDDLRTRIKQSIDQAHKSTHPHSTYDDWLGFAADAVIRELGLQRQSGWSDEAITQGVSPDSHRYVTEWTADE